MADKQEFKFPDEVEAENKAKEASDKEEFSIEIIDDMPAEDRANAKPMPK